MSGVILDRKMNVKLRAKVYKTVGRPVMMYDVETLAIRGKEEGLPEKKETRLLRWIWGMWMRELGKKRRYQEKNERLALCTVGKLKEARLM